MTLVLEIFSWFSLLGGMFFSMVGGIGIVRLPDFFSRIHGGGITDTLGVGMIIVGLLLQPTTFLSLVSLKLIMILFFLAMTSPSSCHALARSAISHGLKPELEKRVDNSK